MEKKIKFPTHPVAPVDEEEPASKNYLKKIEVTGQVRKDGFYIGIHQGRKIKSLKITYPPSIWARYPKPLKQLLLDNVAFLATYHLPFVAGTPMKIEYSTAYPQIQAPVLKNMTLSIPFYNFLKKVPVEKMLKIILNSQYEFKGYTNRDSRLNYKVFKSYSNRVVVPFTFGKDSLLTTALSKALKMKPTLIFVEESEELFETIQKKKLRARYEREFKDKIEFLKSPLDSLRESGVDGWFGWELQLTSMALLLIPFAYAYKSRYIFFSNEKSCDSFTFDRNGFKLFPDFEQSREWTRELSLIAEGLTGGRVQVRNLLESVDDLAIIKILYGLFPEYAKYQSSCFSEHRRAKTRRWCGRCSKCARIYILLKANKIDPKIVGFNENLMQGKFKRLYSAFGQQKTHDSAYEISQVGRLEELLSFYLAYKNGCRGDLIDLFKKRHLKTIAPRAEKLIKRFYSLTTFDLAPAKYRKKLKKLFLKGLRA
ncbi:MAG: hypothetical protein AAB486_02870 [Patescibacteria group bacterium]